MSDIILWYIWMQVFALGGWFVASRCLGGLPDHGYGISKPLGFLLAGFAYWMVVTLGLAPNAPGAILLALVLVILAGLTLGRLLPRQEPARPFVWLPRPSVIIATELIFGIAFVLCAVYRSYTPDIVEAGGEKFMESMFLNAILRSPSFPPNDAWLSGFSISYYYFGYIILAMITKISGIAPAIAFNLGGAMIFALTCVAAFSVGYNLWGTYRLRTSQEASSAAPPKIPGSALLAGVFATLMLAVMGNLGGLMESARCMRVLPQSFWTWLDVRQIAAQPVECQGLIPTRFYWWWDWSRVIHDYTPTGADQEVITETPAFSFILGDNHPHVMSLPFVLIAVTLGLYYLTAQTGKPSQLDHNDAPEALPPEGNPPAKEPFTLDDMPVSLWLQAHAPHLVLSAIVIGGLSFMNTWDFPVYGALMAGALLLGRWYRRESLLPGVVSSIIVFALGYLLYLPFYSTFASQARGIGENLFNGTRFSQFCMMFATFIVAAPLFALQTAHQMHLPTRRTLGRIVGYLAGALVLALVAVAILGLLSTQGRAYLAELNNTGSVMGVTREKVIQLLIQRVTDPWTPLYLLALAIFCAVLILTPPWERTHAQPGDPSMDIAARLTKSYVLLMFLGGALLTVAVEFIFLQDLFGTRMNTVFKFYYQGWTVWALAGSFALMSLLENRRWITHLGAALVGLCLLAGLLFPAYAALSRTNNFNNSPTLDGSAYLQKSHPEDAAIIDWLNRNVEGAPVIAEAPGDAYLAYSYTGRISAFTGLPTLLGWGGHEQQWRGNYTEPATREPYIKTLFNSTDAQEAQSIMQQYKVRYVIVGQTERQKYSAEGLDKFRQICEIAFQKGQSVVYQCNS